MRDDADQASANDKANSPWRVNGVHGTPYRIAQDLSCKTKPISAGPGCLAQLCSIGRSKEIAKPQDRGAHSQDLPVLTSILDKVV